MLEIEGHIAYERNENVYMYTLDYKMYYGEYLTKEEAIDALFNMLVENYNANLDSVDKG